PRVYGDCLCVGFNRLSMSVVHDATGHRCFRSDTLRGLLREKTAFSCVEIAGEILWQRRFWAEPRGSGEILKRGRVVLLAERHEKTEVQPVVQMRTVIRRESANESIDVRFRPRAACRRRVRFYAARAEDFGRLVVVLLNGSVEVVHRFAVLP